MRIFLFFMIILQFLLSSSSFDFNMVHIRNGRKYYQLKKEHPLFEHLCKIFEPNNIVWIENSIQDLIEHMYISVGDELKYFVIEYFYLFFPHYPYKQNRIKYHIKLYILSDDEEKPFFKFNPITAEKIPHLKNNYWSLMYVKTIMVSYGYYWIKMMLNKSKYDLDNIKGYKQAGPRNGNLKSNLQVRFEDWSRIERLFIKNLGHPKYMSDFGYLQIKREIVKYLQMESTGKLALIKEEPYQNIPPKPFKKQYIDNSHSSKAAEKMCFHIPGSENKIQKFY